MKYPGYLPVSHAASIPDETVDQLGKLISASKTPILLFCRSGRRAARAWSLAEASRPDGFPPAAIQRVVEDAGFSIDDLTIAIAERVAHRKSSGAKQP